jgi:hypothetical protein
VALLLVPVEHARCDPGSAILGDGSLRHSLDGRLVAGSDWMHGRVLTLTYAIGP